jgi:hypothetical protein
MSSFDPSKLHVRYLNGSPASRLDLPRRYTLTHSDVSGDLFLAIGADYDQAAISGWYTRLMRDEVLAEWLPGEQRMALHVYCHVSGGLAFGPAGWRNDILKHHLPQVLQAFHYGDADLYRMHPELDHSPVRVHFRARQVKYHRVEAWGIMGDYGMVALPTKEIVAP